MSKPICAGLLALLLGGCLATAPVAQGTRIDELPMYGGIDRSAVATLKTADEKFIAEVSAQFGSRQWASVLWVNRGYQFYRQDQLGMAMRRFNQAWLLDPENAEVYAGFASVLHDQAQNCAAMQMMEKALALKPPTFQGIYPDAGRTLTLCAVSDQTLSPEARSQMLERSEQLYQQAEALEPNKAYLYGSWASAYYWRGQYAESWAMVEKQRAAGGQPGAEFLDLLQKKMPAAAPR